MTDDDVLQRHGHERKRCSGVPPNVGMAFLETQLIGDASQELISSARGHTTGIDPGEATGIVRSLNE